MPGENKSKIDEKQCIQARETILKDLQTELIGPEYDAGLLFENPVPRYAAGMLFPADFGQKKDTKDGEKSEDALKDIEESEDALPEEGESDDDFADDMTAAFANNFYPSAMAMSFYGIGKGPELKVKVKAATYKKTTDLKEIYVMSPELPTEITSMKEFVDNFEYENGAIRLKDRPDGSRDLDSALKDAAPETVKHKLYKLLRSQSQGAWLRSEQVGEIVVSSNTKREKVFDGMNVVIVRKYLASKNLTLFTLALENIFPSSGVSENGVFFQTSFTVESASGTEVFSEYGNGDTHTEDPEDINLSMLYRNKKTYAVGHGCAAEWIMADGKAVLLRSSAIPTYEVPQASFDIAELAGAKTLGMHFLCGLSGSDADIFQALEEFCTLYEKWIDGLKGEKASLPSIFEQEGERNIGLCEEVLARMRSGLDVLKKNAKAFEAFKLANRSMLMQSMHSDLQKTRRSPGDGQINWPKIDSEAGQVKRWRPFQLAFLLLSVRGTVEPSSDDRKIVDLIWFPTGGGKTEAYLGLSAFTILYQRLTSTAQKFGTAIMMRYTLRLLTAQQFQRASTLICALEVLRRETPSLGEEEISIGLWVGSASTPNSIDDAERKYQFFLTNSYAPAPSPVLSCPWCGTRMLMDSEGRRDYAMRKKRTPKRMELFCKEDSCAFNGRSSKLPIKFIDEDIYAAAPTLLFGTVDKFAQMPRRQGVAEIFGLNGGAGPQLIIQDELHLISGALGTMVALYETAVDFLSSRNKIAPKIIASTATVRRAGEQCRNLFGREFRQFPSPGLDIKDSFFAKEDSERPGRLYAGIMPSGKTQTTAAVRLTAKLVQSVYELDLPDNVKDKYWTLVSYFNSIRELGGYISLIDDDISLYARNLLARYGRHMRPIFEREELTSREKAERIIEILDQLSVEYRGEEGASKRSKDDRPIDIVVATNMISVGVDIDRFGLMLLRGQPKMTSEYIQVSSRIGRKYPGLAIMLYNPARTRDRAHYERFTTYHGSFYRNVEPSSITPFSLPARTRALNSILVTMVRHSLATPNINEEKGVSEFRHNQLGVAEIKEFILKRVGIVDATELKEVETDIDRAWQEWESFSDGFASSSDKPTYSSYKGMSPALLASSTKEKRPIGWLAPNSMRNVDTESIINTRDE